MSEEKCGICGKEARWKIYAKYLVFRCDEHKDRVPKCDVGKPIESIWEILPEPIIIVKKIHWRQVC